MSSCSDFCKTFYKKDFIWTKYFMYLEVKHYPTQSIPVQVMYVLVLVSN